MLQQVSWASYWIVLGTISIIYYLIICFRYYLSDIKKILSGKSKFAFNKTAHDNPISFENEFVESSLENLFPVINQLVQEIKMMLREAGERNLIKQEIICAFQLLLKKYPTVKGTSFQSIVDNHILNECLRYCSIHLDEDELNMLWKN